MYFLDSLIFSITLNCFGFLLCPTWHNLNFFFENLHLSNFQNSYINMLNLYKIQQIIFISELFTWVLKSIKLYRLGGGFNLLCMNGSEDNTCKNEFIFQVILSKRVTPSESMAVYLSEETFFNVSIMPVIWKVFNTFSFSDASIINYHYFYF